MLSTSTLKPSAQAVQINLSRPRPPVSQDVLITAFNKPARTLEIFHYIVFADPMNDRSIRDQRKYPLDQRIYPCTDFLSQNYIFCLELSNS